MPATVVDIILTNSADVDPVYAEFLATGAPISQWKEYQDRVGQEPGSIGSPWRVEEYYSGVYRVLRDSAPYGETRHEYTAAGGEKTYRSEKTAEKSAAHLNKI